MNEMNERRPCEKPDGTARRSLVVEFKGFEPPIIQENFYAKT